MALIDIQRGLAEVGRIRLGEKDGNRPVKRETWRLTSRARKFLEAAQTVYPGELRAWKEQWELLTETDELRIMVLPGQRLSQWYELWSGGGCQRRCDGERTTTPEDGPCLCPIDHRERTKLAQKGRACKATSRLSVMLPDVPGIGCWRLESHGYYAAVELAGMADILEHVTALGVMLPALLWIDQRSSLKDGQIRRYPVPVIDIGATPNEVRALGSGSPALEGVQLSRPHPYQGAPPKGRGPLDTHEEHGPRTPTGSRSPIAEAAVKDPGPPISEHDRKRVFAVARKKGMTEDALRKVIEHVTGQTSTAAIPRSRLDELIKVIEAAR